MNSIKEEVTLLPCPNPWCVGDPFVWKHPHGFHAVSCSACEISAPNKPSRAEAIAAWNTREPDLRAKAEGLEARLNEAREVLTVFARIADMEHRAGINDSVMVNVKHCRKARDIVAEWDQSQ